MTSFEGVERELKLLFLFFCWKSLLKNSLFGKLILVIAMKNHHHHEAEIDPRWWLVLRELKGSSNLKRKSESCRQTVDTTESPPPTMQPHCQTIKRRVMWTRCTPFTDYQIQICSQWMYERMTMTKQVKMYQISIYLGLSATNLLITSWIEKNI